ncbi:hypothetical protein ACYZUA_17110 [Pseudomonas sp. LS2P72]
MTDFFPSRLIIDDRQIVVILDTAPARILGEQENCPQWAETFAKMARDGYCFSLADGTFVELVNQRSRGSITAVEFHRMCTRLTRFISTELPVAPGRSDLLGMIQQSSESWSEQECRSQSLAAWAELLRCANVGYVPRSTEQLLEEERNSWRAMLANFQEKVDIFKKREQLKVEILHALDESGLLHALRIVPEPESLKALEALHTLHSCPVEELLNILNLIPRPVLQKVIQSLEPLNKGDLRGVLDLAKKYRHQKQCITDAEADPTLAWKAWTDQQISWKIIGPQIFEGFSKAFKSSGSTVFTMKMRSHLELLYCWTQFSSMQKAKRAYDPNSVNSRNDGIDFDLYRFLKLPAFVVTLDKGFLEGLIDIKSYQAAWFFRPQELADSWSAGDQPKPSWPTAKDLAKR